MSSAIELITGQSQTRWYRLGDALVADAGSYFVAMLPHVVCEITEESEHNACWQDMPVRPKKGSGKSFGKGRGKGRGKRKWQGSFGMFWMEKYCNIINRQWSVDIIPMKVKHQTTKSWYFAGSPWDFGPGTCGVGRCCFDFCSSFDRIKTPISQMLTTTLRVEDWPCWCATKGELSLRIPQKGHIFWALLNHDTFAAGVMFVTAREAESNGVGICLIMVQAHFRGSERCPIPHPICAPRRGCCEEHGKWCDGKKGQIPRHGTSSQTAIVCLVRCKGQKNTKRRHREIADSALHQRFHSCAWLILVG